MIGSAVTASQWMDVRIKCLESGGDMTDVEKVIKGLKCCQSRDYSCEGCPYENDQPHRYVEECLWLRIGEAIKLLESQRWIPVSEQLPRQEDIPYDCLVVSNGFVCEASFLDRDAVHRWCASGAGWLRTDAVTHWRPKPAPPRRAAVNITGGNT